ncbi:MAG: hypothetical protein AAF388_27255, partial [Bacteroidota bacterium]
LENVLFNSILLGADKLTQLLDQFLFQQVSIPEDPIFLYKDISLNICYVDRNNHIHLSLNSQKLRSKNLDHAGAHPTYVQV